MARDLVLDVISRAHGRGLERTAHDLDRTADSAERLDGSFEGTAHSAGFVDAEIERLTARIGEVGREIDRTGKLDLYASIRDDRAALRKLQRVKKEIASVTREAEKAADSGAGVVGGAADQLRELGAKTKLILVGAAIAASPAIGAAIAGAVTAAVGAGGIAAGLAAASRDARVRQAGAELAATFSAAADTIAMPFIEPATRALADLGDAVDRNVPQLSRALADLAPLTVTLSEGVGGFVDALTPGLSTALRDSAPLMRAFADWLPQLGADLGDLLSDFASSPGALEGFIATLDLIDASLRFVGGTITWLSDRWANLVDAGAAISGVAEDIWGWVPLVGSGFRGLNDLYESWQDRAAKASDASGDYSQSLSEVQHAAEDTEAALDSLVQKLQDEFDALMNSDSAHLTAKESLLRLRDQLDKNRGAWDENTQAGIDNQQAVLHAIEAAERERESRIKDGKSIDEANAHYQRQIEKIMKIGEQAGISRKELQKLAGKYYVTTVYASVDTGNPRTHHDSYAPTYRGYATGTSSAPPGWAWVGEAGPELMRMRGGEQVLTAAQSRAMASDRTTVEIRSGGGGPTDRMFAALIINLVRTGTLKLSVVNGRVAVA